MDFNKLPLIGMLTGKMSWLSQRAEVLAENIANADTPGYVARDLEEVDFARMVRRANGAHSGSTRMTLTHAAHLTPPSMELSSFRDQRDDSNLEVTPNGNNVNLDEQMIMVARTQMSYQTMVDLYRKQMSMFRTAIGK